MLKKPRVTYVSDHPLPMYPVHTSTHLEREKSGRQRRGAISKLEMGAFQFSRCREKNGKDAQRITLSRYNVRTIVLFCQGIFLKKEKPLLAYGLDLLYSNDRVNIIGIRINVWDFI